MVSRLDKHDYEPDQNNSRVARNQELYKQLYEDDSYLKENSQTSLDRTTEIDIEKVRELLRGRETYRKEMKMREYNIIGKEEAVDEEESINEEKNYDINDYLHKASNEREYQPYHKLDYEAISIEKVIENTEEDEEKIPDKLENLGNTELSLNLFADLSPEDDEDNEETIEDNVPEEEIENSDDSEEDEEIEDEEDDDDTFFTGAVKIRLSDNESEDEAEDGLSTFVKIIIIVLVLIIVGLAVLLFVM